MSLIVIPYDKKPLQQRVLTFLDHFVNLKRGRKCVLGCNLYSSALIKVLTIDVIIDDFSCESTFNGVPIIHGDKLTESDMVIVASGGRPLTAKSMLDRIGLMQIDYFSFQKYSGLNLPELVFNEGMSCEVEKNKSKFEWVYERLHDDLSRKIYSDLLNFRLNQDLVFLQDYRDRQSEQYFEDFLNLNVSGEVFFDVGGFDGYTSAEFASRFPDYKAIVIFEPEPSNKCACEKSLAEQRDVIIYPFGLSDSNRTLYIEPAGSASRITSTGSVSIEVRRLDDLQSFELIPSMIKMDIEGDELQAIRGASKTIREYRPRMAVSIYHHPSDLWRIPWEVIAVCPSYKIYIRHYTESIYETIMFFVP